MKTTTAILIAAFCTLAGIALLRTARFASRQIQVPPAREIPLERAEMFARLSKAVQHQTISAPLSHARATAAFAQFRATLANSFPMVHAHLARETVGDHSLLYSWKGQDPSLKPILFVGHMDVVPVEAQTETRWTYPPFSGRIAGGYIWGRGTMDDKAAVVAILEAAEHLLAGGFTPQRSLYFAFGHDEEIGGGNGAAKIAALLRGRNLDFDFVLDEGGNIVEGIIPGVAAPVALIGIAEKGYVTLELTVEEAGGHASTPPDHTAIGILSGAIARLERSPFPERLSPPIREMFAFIGPEMAWQKKFVLANLWLFDPLVRRELAASPLTRAAIRSTQAATVFQAGVSENALPQGAKAILNIRILPGDTVAGVIDRVHRVIDNRRVKISSRVPGVEPSPISSPHSPAFKRLQRALKEVAPEILVAPSLLVAATDARHYANLTRNVFRFVPITLRAEDARRYHGIDERISARDYERCVRFFVQLMRHSE